jgi:molybdenum cofactor synthesis domain-containing protein
MMQSSNYADPDSAIDALAKRLSVVTDTVTTSPSGRILAQTIVADRDSPAADVSAMDGYAICLSDLSKDSVIPIGGESKTGSPPPTMRPGQVIRIFTGAIVPAGCEAVVKREDTDESDSSICFRPVAVKTTVAGSHIRRAGENAAAGSAVLPRGSKITPPVVAALANFGVVQPLVYRSVKVAILTTGNEVVDPAAEQLKPWQLRNSNQAATFAMLSQHPFIDVIRVEHVSDDRDALADSLNQAIQIADAVVLTGGVSKGDYDYVPETISLSGGETVFHGLPIRPGKPILGAATKDGKLILGLPGNPVSATINCHRFLLPLLRRVAGQVNWRDKPPLVTLREPPKAPIALHAMLLARSVDSGIAELVAAKGSGDLVALAQSDGYVCVPPNTRTLGPWPMLAW